MALDLLHFLAHSFLRQLAIECRLCSLSIQFQVGARNWWVWFHYPFAHVHVLEIGGCGFNCRTLEVDYYVLAKVNAGQGLCPLSKVERCSFLGGCNSGRRLETSL